MRINLHIDETVGRIHAAAAQGLGLAAEHILNASNVHVPHEVGDLQGSGTVSQDDLTAVVSYDTPYAARQHEELSWAHDPGRSAKFLENAANAEADTAAQIIADTVRRSLGG